MPLCLSAVSVHSRLSLLVWRVCFLALTLAVLLVSEARAQSVEPVRLAAVEMAPYLGADIERQGYAADLVKRAMARSGQAVEIRFYPPARALSLVESGQIDGMLFVGGSAASSAALRLSRPFPGVNLGLLKRRVDPIPYAKDADRRPAETLRSLAGYRIGAVRGLAVPAVFEAEAALRREYVANDLQNLDKLALGRIDLMLVDKYRASDLMVLHRPHLIGQLEFLNPPLFPSSFHIAWAVDTPRREALAKAFDSALQAMQADGQVSEILFSHGLRAGEMRNDATVRLTIGTVNNPDMLVMRRLSAEFERTHPGIELDWRVIDETVLRTRLMTDLAIADGQFDVMTIGSYETPIWGQRGWLEPLDNLPSAYGIDDLIPSVRASLTYQGRLYALPFYAESSMTYYRTDLFERAGLSMPKQPAYDDIERFARRLHDPAGGVYGLCLRGKPGWGENISVIAPMANTYGGRWFDASWRPELESAGWREAVTRYVSLLQQYGPPDAAERGYRESLLLFAEGRCAMWIDATVAAGYLFNPRVSSVASKVGYAAAPIGRVDVGESWLWSWALAIPASSSRKVQARKFIEWATSRSYVERVGRDEGWIAVPPGTRLSTYAQPAYLAVAPFARFVASSISEAQVDLPGRHYRGIQTVSIAEFPAVGYALAIEINRALTGRITVDQALRNAQVEVRRIMEAAGYYNETLMNR